MPGPLFLVKVDFVLKLAAALHQYGTPAHRLEQALTLVSDKIGLKSQIFSTPTAIIATLRGSEDEVTRILRIQPGEVDLGKLSELDRLGDDAIAGRVSLADCAKRIDWITAEAPIYSRPLLAISHGLSSLGFACMFGASGRDLLWSFAVGSMIGVLHTFAKRYQRIQRVYEASAAVMAAVVASLAAYFEPRISAPTVLLAGLIPLLPGLMLTIALNELATQNLIAGTARFMGVVMKLLQLVFGVVMGTKLVGLFVDLPDYVASRAIPEPFIWLGLTAAASAAVVLYKAPPKDAGWVALASAIGFSAAKLGALLIGSTLGAFVGGFAVGASANLFARIYKRPAQLIVLPGLVQIVPGALGYQSVTFFAHNDVLKGVNTGFDMFLVAVTIVAGLMFGNVFISPKRSL